MALKIMNNIYDSTMANSWATNLRKKRFSLFESLLESIPGPVKILDVGGTQIFWENLGLFAGGRGDVEITLINMKEIPVSGPNFKSVVGDARNMKTFKDSQFDVVFSNSVIEHVGDYSDQLRMAQEIKRVGQRYFVQTPNRYFPIEPHFVFPFFQFLPLSVRVWLLSHFNLGWYEKIPDRQTATLAVKEIRLLAKKEVMELFALAKLFEEKILGITKSFIVYDGWDTP
jgi:ubiquinone/menaquinone biosynthesis C-methylase UbiE